MAPAAIAASASRLNRTILDSLLDPNDKCLQAPRKKITARVAPALNFDFDLDTMA
jgi:hypothetical protein